MSDAIPGREFFWNIQGEWVIYPLAAGLVLLLAVFGWRRYRLWRLGRPDDRFDHKVRRLKDAVAEVLGQRRVRREAVPGVMHLLIAGGMVVLLIATTLTALETDFGVKILHGDFYLVVIALGGDLGGLAVTVGVAIALYRRYVRRAEGVESLTEDAVVLALLLATVVSGFFVEGLRIVATDDPWAAWSPVGLTLALLLAGLTPGVLEASHRVLWWGHLLVAFAFLACFAWTKLAHVGLIPANIFFRSSAPKGSLPFVDMADEDAVTFGVARLEDFTWKDLLDADACVRCGRCQNSCPAYLSGKPLSPKALMLDLRAHLAERGRARPGPAGRESAQASAETELVGHVVAPDALWACTTCGACMEQCPALIEHVPKIVQMRRHQVLVKSDFPSEAIVAFRNMETNGNPWGIGWQTRASWAAGLGVPTIAAAPEAEYLYWPGCSGAFDARNRKVTEALVRVLQAAGVTFAILGNEERCCGDAARRLGNEFLYHMLARENIASLERHRVTKILVQCPHCLNTLRNDYPQLGGTFEVVHHAELLARLLADGKLVRTASSPGPTVTYHDPCYLGRYNGVYDAPRAALAAVGAGVAEMELAREKGFCCGGGGGRMWLDETLGERIGAMRADQAFATGAVVVATACPYCMTMLSDGCKAREADLVTMDIAELVAAQVLPGLAPAPAYRSP